MKFESHPKITSARSSSYYSDVPIRTVLLSTTIMESLSTVRDLLILLIWSYRPYPSLGLQFSGVNSRSNIFASVAKGI